MSTTIRLEKKQVVVNPSWFDFNPFLL